CHFCASRRNSSCGKRRLFCPDDTPVPFQPTRKIYFRRLDPFIFPTYSSMIPARNSRPPPPLHVREAATPEHSHLENMRTRSSGSSYLRLALTRLEDRTVPAVTATLLNGVLSVLGDSAPNNISIGLSNGQITVSGIAETFSAGQVASITVCGG